MKALIPFLLTAAALTVNSPAIADVLLIDVIADEPANTSSGLARPVNGQSMARVQQVFGTPLQQSAAVGEPPITRWRYDRFTVVFEHNLVIYSVVHR